jgi:thiamine kinase-like enzyme
MTIQLSNHNISQYLQDQGLIDSPITDLTQLESKSAKNFNLLWKRPDETAWLIKQERFKRDGKVVGEFQTEWHLHELIGHFPELHSLKPELPQVIHYNPDAAIWISPYLTQYQDLSEFYLKEKQYPVSVAIALGKLIARFHQATYRDEPHQRFLQSHSPKTSEDKDSSIATLSLGLDRITPEIYSQVPSDGLRFFSLYQRFDSLGEAITDLRKQFNPCCLTHQDLKINNVLIHQEWETAPETSDDPTNTLVRLIDWERNGWGDPAFDLGTLIASYLQLWLSSLVVSQEIPLEESLKLAAIPLESLQPSMSGFLQGYLTQFPEGLTHDPALITRTIQFAGFALIQQIQAQLQYNKMFGNQGICMLQVAKSLLSRPERSLVTITGVDAPMLQSTV